MVPQAVRTTLDGLSDDQLVLDVGGWGSADPRADWVIDIGSYETRNYYLRRFGLPLPKTAERFTAKSWVQMDICATPWPFAEATFDYVICSHTLEDVRDPIQVCEEMMRVGKAGYIETPAAPIELTRGIESPHWCGWRHHRWLVREDGGGLVFLVKPHHIHSPMWPAVRSPRFLTGGPDQVMRFQWREAFPVREEIVVDAQSADDRLNEIIASARTPDPAGDAVHAMRRSLIRAYWGARAQLATIRRR